MQLNVGSKLTLEADGAGWRLVKEVGDAYDYVRVVELTDNELKRLYDILIVEFACRSCEGK